MAKTRVYEVAKTLELDADELVRKINHLNLGFTVRDVMNALSEDEVSAVQKALQREQRRAVVQERIRPTVIRRRSRKRGSSARSDEPSSEEAASPSSSSEAEALAQVDAPQTSPPSTPAVDETSSQRGVPGVRVRRSRPAAPVAPPPEPPAPEPVVEEEVVAAALSADVEVEDESAGNSGIVIRRGRRSKSPRPAPTPTPEPEVEEAVAAQAEAPDAQTGDESHRVSIKIRPASVVTAAPPAPVEVSAEDGEAEVEEEDEDGANARSSVTIRRGRKPRQVAENDDENASGSRSSISIRRGASARSSSAAPAAASAKADATAREDGPTNVVGHIDPGVILERLAKDNKTFNPETKTARPGTAAAAAGDPAARDAKRAVATARRRPQRRAVDNPTDLYGGRRAAVRGRGRGRGKGRGKAPGERTQITQAAEHKRVIRIDTAVSVGRLAQDMGVKASEIIKKLMGLGIMATLNQSLDAETAELVAQDFNFSVVDEGFKEDEVTAQDEDAPEDLVFRAPVVAVMGHVDHGKTSLLDAIRDTNVTEREAGGITQHIGASTVDLDGGRLVFLDTPGHEAFTALRARGANVTDLVILVVAADDGVMPQTVEAINHARAAEVPIIVAINKIDKPGANPDRIKQALTEYSLIPEEWGGETQFVEVSALQRTGVEDLLESVLLQSEILELKANPSKEARGVVLEAYKDVGRGTVATLIVQEGALRPGDIAVSGHTYGRVRTMRNDRGKELAVAGPSTAVEITGLSELPSAGEMFFVTQDEKTAREYTEHVKARLRKADLASNLVDPWTALRKTKKLNLIIKGDVQGSVEALSQSLLKLSDETDEVDVHIIHGAVGGITESDVQLAAASNALVIGFNTRPESRASELAKREGVFFELHTVIYDVIDHVRQAMAGLLDPILEQSSLGTAEVRDIFRVPKLGTIAGCYVTDGKILRGAKARVFRDSKIVYDNTHISSLRRFKDDVREVKNGFECGLSVANFNDIKIGDIIEVYEIKEVKATL